MSVYVDDMEAPFGRMKMCHLYADTLAELHEMADRIGVARRWFQKESRAPHYDICLSKKKAALGFGAVEVEYWSGHMAAFAGEGFSPRPQSIAMYERHRADNTELPPLPMFDDRTAPEVPHV